MWRMRVVHETGYAYKGPVTASYNEARLTPRSDSRQNVIINRVETAPATRSYRYVDYWGTAVTAFDLHAPHSELEVTSSSVVETEKPERPAAEIGWAELTSAAIADRFDEVLAPTEYTPLSKRIDRVGRHLAKGCDPREAVIAAVQWVRGELRYVPGTTGVHSSGLDALREGQGVCQDFAHLQLSCLRSLGLAARYVSGYLRTLPPPGKPRLIGADASHAWISIYCGRDGWVDLDPTNNTLTRLDHVTVAWGRDYHDVCPIQGVILGGGDHQMQVSVDLEALP